MHVFCLTQLPLFRPGTHRPVELMFDYPSYGVPVSAASVDAVEAALTARDAQYLSAWQVDPLSNAASRAARVDHFNQYVASTPPHERTLTGDYMALRLITHELVAVEKGR